MHTVCCVRWRGTWQKLWLDSPPPELSHANMATACHQIKTALGFSVNSGILGFSQDQEDKKSSHHPCKRSRTCTLACYREFPILLTASHHQDFHECRAAVRRDVRYRNAARAARRRRRRLDLVSMIDVTRAWHRSPPPSLPSHLSYKVASWNELECGNGEVQSNVSRLTPYHLKRLDKYQMSSQVPN